MRGRLIFPFLVELAQLDTAATADDPDGDGPIESGYDSIFREPIVVANSDASGDTSGVLHRVETMLQAPAQIETRAWDQLEQIFSGANPNAAMELVFHYQNLEELGLIDATGNACIRVNDRLNAIYTMDGNLVKSMPASSGLFATEVRDSGFGFGNTRNLLIVTFQDRDKGTRQTT